MQSVCLPGPVPNTYIIIVPLLLKSIQNNMEVFEVDTYERTTFDLVSLTGQGGRTGPAAACFGRSVLDDATLPLNDPAPDLMDVTPDGRYIMIALRGPAPVSVSHSAQGSCPGVGIVELLDCGRTGRLVGVLRASNLIEDEVEVQAPGGINYAGFERADVHGVFVVPK